MKTLVVGAGLSGSTVARLCAESGDEVVVIDKREHVAGNCYDYVNEHGILMPKYGAHIFHTSHEDVWQFVSTFTEFSDYKHVVKSHVDGKIVPVPVNRKTFEDILGIKFDSPEDMQEWIDKQHPEIDVPKNSEESALKRIGSVELYEKMFKSYTKKQWDKYPEELDASVMDRIPVRTDYNERYFSDKHEGIPLDGYTKMVENILNHDNIFVQLNKEFTRDLLDKYDRIFFTGKVDTYFDHEFGKLEYRSILFEDETLNIESYQENSVINYPQPDVDFTRIIEHKKIYGQKSDVTTITREYSTDEGEEYYPVPNESNQEIYKKYQEKASKLEKNGIYFVGRLANYKYLNMDQAIKAALDIYERINNEN